LTDTGVGVYIRKDDRSSGNEWSVLNKGELQIRVWQTTVLTMTASTRELSRGRVREEEDRWVEKSWGEKVKVG
jgi:hypothetical protein